MFGARALGVFAAFAVLGTSAAVAPGCAKKEAEKTTGIFQPQDFAPPPSQGEGPGEGEAERFDRNKILETTSLVDSVALDAAALQDFFHRTPYDRPSFLETYQSNGIRPADAIARAARAYKINPLAFLVAAQGTQGLIGEVNYPFPPERVEYVFRCGCLRGDDCVPTLAGFDRQVDCLARSLRVALDQITLEGHTTAGWGKDIEGLTLDNVKVKPATEATAALYDRFPRVAEGSAGGTWFYWNVWNLYAARVHYAGPTGGPGIGGWIGDKCASTGNCEVDGGATCATNFPGGFCTVECKGICPSLPDRPEAFCADFKTSGGFCLPVCDGKVPCRDGYSCVTMKRFGAISPADAKSVCSVP